MAYIGNSLPANFQSLPAVQRFNGNASTTAFTLAAAIANDQSILVSVDGVVQDSNAYSVSGTTLTFTAAPSSGTGNIFVNTISPVGSTLVPPDGVAINASTGTFSGDLTVDTSTLKVDSSNNKVGIGTTSPSTQLHIENSGGNASAQLTSGTSGTSFINMGDTGDADIGQISYLNSANAMSFTANAAERMRIDADGHITKPSQPAFLARPSGTQSNIAVSTAVDVAFATEVFDVGSNFATPSFTAPVTGSYFFSTSVDLEALDSAALYYSIQLVTSNRSYITIFDPDFGQDAGFWTVSLTVLADMDASDTAKVVVTQSGGTQQTDIISTSYFSGYLAC
jgi:hypothetical protein